ncbi:MAG: indole-3-glycerol phosphate synthase TrpC [Candidatus Omnitrophica bacterium]|nr:indole-3-glycerol phosphate synthase TrpC [Candidatus Omnitrophota bacterium]
MNKSFLDIIVVKKREKINARRHYYENIKSHLDKTEYGRYGLFKKAISKTGRMSLIAEIKRASPSKGVIRDDFNPEDIARAYEKAGADALSILTEEDFFQGKAAYLKRIGGFVRVPTLMKDFLVDELQLFEARYCGASAVLLIVAILSDSRLKDMYQAATALDLDCLIEVHDEVELERALKLGAEIIGVNNRDLHSFDVALATSEKLIPRIPKDRVIVAESGIKSYTDVKRLEDLGANAVLIGEIFMRERDIASKVREVMYG